MKALPHTCPRCASRTSPAGTMTINGKTFPLFACPNCKIQVGPEHQPVQTSFVYAVDEAGQIWDAARIAAES